MENIGRETKKIYKFSFFRQKTRKTIARTSRIVVLFIDNFTFSNSNSRAENFLEQLYCYRSLIYNANILIYEIIFVKDDHISQRVAGEPRRSNLGLKKSREKIQRSQIVFAVCLPDLDQDQLELFLWIFCQNIVFGPGGWRVGTRVIRLTRTLPS